MAYIIQTGGFSNSVSNYQPPPYSSSSYNNNNGVGGQVQFVTQPMPQQISPGGAGGKFGVHYYRKTSIGLGVVFIVCGVASIVGGILYIATNGRLHEVGTGVWCGAILVVTGSIAIPAGRHLLDSLIVSTTVMSYISIAAGIVQISIAGTGLGEDMNYWDCPSKYCANGYCYCMTNWMYDAALASNIIMIVTGSLAMVIGTWLAIVQSKAVCCSSTPNQVLCIQVPCSTVGPMQYSEQNQSIIQIDPRQHQMQQVPYGAMTQQQQQQPVMQLQAMQPQQQEMYQWHQQQQQQHQQQQQQQQRYIIVGHPPSVVPTTNSPSSSQKNTSEESAVKL